MSSARRRSGRWPGVSSRSRRRTCTGRPSSTNTTAAGWDRTPVRRRPRPPRRLTKSSDEIVISQAAESRRTLRLGKQPAALGSVRAAVSWGRSDREPGRRVGCGPGIAGRYPTDPGGARRCSGRRRPGPRSTNRTLAGARAARHSVFVSRQRARAGTGARMPRCAGARPERGAPKVLSTDTVQPQHPTVGSAGDHSLAVASVGPPRHRRRSRDQCPRRELRPPSPTVLAPCAPDGPPRLLRGRPR